MKFHNKNFKKPKTYFYSPDADRCTMYGELATVSETMLTGRIADEMYV